MVSSLPHTLPIFCAGMWSGDDIATPQSKAKGDDAKNEKGNTTKDMLQWNYKGEHTK